MTGAAAGSKAAVPVKMSCGSTSAGPAISIENGISSTGQACCKVLLRMRRPRGTHAASCRWQLSVQMAYGQKPLLLLLLSQACYMPRSYAASCRPHWARHTTGLVSECKAPAVHMPRLVPGRKPAEVGGATKGWCDETNSLTI